jgi:hypothetical protein
VRLSKGMIMIDEKWIKDALKEINKSPKDNVLDRIMSIVKDYVKPLFIKDIHMCSDGDVYDDSELMEIICCINDRETDEEMYLMTFFMGKDHHVKDIVCNIKV